MTNRFPLATSFRLSGRNTALMRTSRSPTSRHAQRRYPVTVNCLPQSSSMKLHKSSTCEPKARRSSRACSRLPPELLKRTNLLGTSNRIPRLQFRWVARIAVHAVGPEDHESSRRRWQQALCGVAARICKQYIFQQCPTPLTPVCHADLSTKKIRLAHTQLIGASQN